MATIKTTPIIAASTASALEVTTVTEVITRLAAWLGDKITGRIDARIAMRLELSAAEYSNGGSTSTRMRCGSR